MEHVTTIVTIVSLPTYQATIPRVSSHLGPIESQGHRCGTNAAEALKDLQVWWISIWNILELTRKVPAFEWDSLNFRKIEEDSWFNMGGSKNGGIQNGWFRLDNSIYTWMMTGGNQFCRKQHIPVCPIISQSYPNCIILYPHKSHSII